MIEQAIRQGWLFPYPLAKQAEAQQEPAKRMPIVEKPKMPIRK
jgi:hypothetical protein